MELKPGISLSLDELQVGEDTAGALQVPRALRRWRCFRAIRGEGRQAGVAACSIALGSGDETDPAGALAAGVVVVCYWLQVRRRHSDSAASAKAASRRNGPGLEPDSSFVVCRLAYRSVRMSRLGSAG